MVKNPPHTFAVGDACTHPAKPEWGQGKVVKAESITHEGTPAQRLTVRFQGAGLKTLSTAFAKLQPVGETKTGNLDDAINPLIETKPSEPATPRTLVPGGGRDKSEAPPPNPFEKLDPAKAREVMTRLPDEVRDPFLSLTERLTYTFGLYRHTPDGGKLIAWANQQSGLPDPLVAFNRHELEQFFDKYRINRDAHLLELIRLAKRESLDLNVPLRKAPKDAQQPAATAARRLRATL